MELIKGDNLNLNNGNKDILNNASFRILEGLNYGLIGPNGAGKTTLIRLILGEENVDKGTLFVREGLSIGYVPQMQEVIGPYSVADFLGEEPDRLGKRLIELEAEMAVADNEKLVAVLAEYGLVTDAFEACGGYEALEKGKQILNKLGLDNDPGQQMDTLSGGERSLVFFAKALLSDPELLILDEPGNHLDYLGLAWLEAFLQNFKQTLLVVSHNRFFLDKVCDHLIHVERGTLTEFTGNYSRYKSEILRDAVLTRNAYESSKRRQAELRKKISQLQSIAMSQYNPPARIMSQLGAAKRKYAEELAKNLERPDISGNPISLDIAGEASKSDIALRIENLSFGFEDTVLFENADMEILCGERVAFVGRNGIGKSSLLKILIDEGSWDHPHLKIGPGQKIGYLSQVPQFHVGAITVEDEVRSWGPLTKDAAFSLVQNMGFLYEDMDKRIAVLSGGEISRLKLAKFLYTHVNLLILDEPTNHMDIQSRETIESAVDAFEGTILVVSHDRYFLDTLVDRVIEIKDKGFVFYPGNFSDFFHARYPTLPRLKGELNFRGKERQRLTKGTNRAADIERRIEEAEKEKEQLEKELERCIEMNDRKAGHSASVRHEKLIRLLDNLYDEWASLP